MHDPLSLAATTGTPMEDERPHSTPHGWILLVACGIVVLSAMLEVLPDQRVAVKGLRRYPLPNACQARATLGVKCPGCGLTRSFIHLAHGDWRSSVHTHRLGWLMASLVLFQIPYRALAMQGRVFPLFSPRSVTILTALLVALLAGNWLYDIFIVAGSQ